MSGTKQYLKVEDFPLPIGQIEVKVWQNYDALDLLANEHGYKSIEPIHDEKVEESGLWVGEQNGNLHSGWIGTLWERGHIVQDMITLLNRKVQRIKDTGAGLLVGFCQTGEDSVSYTIYVKGEKHEWN